MLDEMKYKDVIEELLSNLKEEKIVIDFQFVSQESSTCFVELNSKASKIILHNAILKIKEVGCRIYQLDNFIFAITFNGVASPTQPVEYEPFLPMRHGNEEGDGEEAHA